MVEVLVVFPTFLVLQVIINSVWVLLLGVKKISPVLVLPAHHLPVIVMKKCMVDYVTQNVNRDFIQWDVVSARQIVQQTASLIPEFPVLKKVIPEEQGFLLLVPIMKIMMEDYAIKNVVMFLMFNRILISPIKESDQCVGHNKSHYPSPRYRLFI